LVETVASPCPGYLQRLDSRLIGETAVLLGAGRIRKSDPIDHGVGIIVHHKVGDRVQEGDPLFTIHANDRALLDEACARLLSGHICSDDPVEPLPLFYGVVRD